MIANNRRRILVSSLIGSAACIITWLLFFSSSAKSEAMRRSVWYGVWSVLNIPVYVFGLSISPGTYADEFVVYVLTFIQWFLIGFLINWSFEHLRRR